MPTGLKIFPLDEQRFFATKVPIFAKHGDFRLMAQMERATTLSMCQT